MLHSLMTDMYFAKIEKGLSKDIVIQGPVTMSSEESDEVIGHIDWYNAKTGHIRVKLFKKVYYKQLVEHGVRRKDIVFNYS